MTQVKQIDIKAIFVKASGHELPTERTIICGADGKPKKFIAGNLGSREQRKVSY